MNESKLTTYVTVYNNERFEETILPQPPWGGGGYFRNFRVGMYLWDPGTLSLYQSCLVQLNFATLYQEPITPGYTKLNSPIPSYARVAFGLSWVNLNLWI